MWINSKKGVLTHPHQYLQPCGSLTEEMLIKDSRSAHRHSGGVLEVKWEWSDITFGNLGIKVCNALSLVQPVCSEWQCTTLSLHLAAGRGSGKIKSGGASYAHIHLISDNDGCTAAFSRPQPAKNNTQTRSILSCWQRCSYFPATLSVPWP